MASLTFHLDSSAKVDSSVSSFLQQARTSQASGLQIVCDKGGEQLTKDVLATLNRPDMKKQYKSAGRDTKNTTCIVVQL